MKQKKSLTDLVFLLIPLAVGGLSAWFTMRGLAAYDQLVQPPLTPPAWVFPVVWSILYVLMGVGAVRVWRSNNAGRTRALSLFFVQLFFNFFWSVWFFGNQWYLFAFLWLLILIAAVFCMLRAFYQVDRNAGLLQIPYLIWCLFAAYLNFAFWILN